MEKVYEKLTQLVTICNPDILKYFERIINEKQSNNLPDDFSLMAIREVNPILEGLKETKNKVIRNLIFQMYYKAPVVRSIKGIFSSKINKFLNYHQ